MRFFSSSRPTENGRVQSDSFRRWRIGRGKRSADPSAPDSAAGRSMRLPPSLVADILLLDPWRHTPPVLQAIARGNAVLNAHLFRESHMAVFADPRHVEMERRAREDEQRWTDEPQPRLKERVLREWGAMSAKRLEDYRQLTELLPRYPQPKLWFVKSEAMRTLDSAVSQATLTAYGQRLLFALATPDQIQYFTQWTGFRLRDARHLQPMLDVQAYRQLGADALDMLNEAGIFSRSLYGNEPVHPERNWFCEVARQICSKDPKSAWTNFANNFYRIVDAQVLLPAVVQASGKSENEICELDRAARQRIELDDTDYKASLRNSVAFDVARDFDFSFLDEAMTKADPDNWNPAWRSDEALAYRSQPGFAAIVQERLGYIACWSETAAPDYRAG